MRHLLEGFHANGRMVFANYVVISVVLWLFLRLVHRFSIGEMSLGWFLLFLLLPLVPAVAVVWFVDKVESETTYRREPVYAFSMAVASLVLLGLVWVGMPFNIPNGVDSEGKIPSPPATDNAQNPTAPRSAPADRALAGDTPLYAAPALDAEQLFFMRADDLYHLTGTTRRVDGNRWCEINYMGHIGWCLQPYCQCAQE